MEKHMRLPPGFRFHPTDEELVVQYLKRKALSCPLPAAIIPEIDLGKFDPWDLPGCHEEERYFFFNLQKYRKGNRSNRATRSGYWKSIGKDRPILCNKRNELVGMKKVLVFHQGKPPHGARTHWVMHEYRLPNPDPDQTLASFTSPQRKNSNQCSLVQDKDWVVCRIFAKKRAPKTEEDVQVRNNHVGFMDMMNDNGNFGARSPPPPSCVTDLSDEECSNGEEASSKLFAQSP